MCFQRLQQSSPVIAFRRSWVKSFTGQGCGSRVPRVPTAANCVLEGGCDIAKPKMAMQLCYINALGRSLLSNSGTKARRCLPGNSALFEMDKVPTAVPTDMQGLHSRHAGSTQPTCRVCADADTDKDMPCARPPRSFKVNGSLLCMRSTSLHHAPGHSAHSVHLRDE